MGWRLLGVGKRGGEGGGLGAVDEYPVGLAWGEGIAEADYLFNHDHFCVGVDGPWGGGRHGEGDGGLLAGVLIVPLASGVGGDGVTP